MGFLQSIIKRDGTSQRQRFQAAQDPGFIRIEERELQDLLRIIGQFAKEVAFYDQQNNFNGDWEDFFPSQNQIPELVNNLDKKNDLTPHLALLVAFLKLLEIVKKDINQLGSKHLKFYYEDVLRFIKKKSVPDGVHVLFGLAKNASDPILLEKGSLLSAGKDDNNQDIFYETDRNIVINKAQIKSLKTILVDYRSDQHIYAAPIANSNDGLGGALNPENPSWNTFGESQQGKLGDERSMPDASVGFAVASPILLLKEGNRTVELELTVERVGTNATVSPFLGLNSNFFMASFSGLASTEEGWFPLNPTSATITDLNKLNLTFQLTVEDPPLVYYPGNEEVNGLPTKYPAIKLLLNPLAEKYAYAFVKDLKILAYQLVVDVIGIKNLVLQNENGPLATDQAFLPFGPRPSVNADLYIGSDEVFHKRLNALSLSLEWADLPTESTGFVSYYEGYGSPFTNSNRQADVRYLQSGNWVIPPDNTIDLFHTFGSGTFSLGPFTLQLPLISNADRNPEIVEFDDFSNKSSSGFIRLSLNTPDFGHHVFQNKYANIALTIANGGSGILPNIPYTPKLKSIALNYTSKESVTFGVQNSRLEQFFHIEPFGSRAISTEHDSFCFPQFAEATLLMGIEALDLLQNLSILFQMLEGSADPDIPILRTDIKWAYLKNDQWIELTDNEIQIDTTQGFQTSGIMEFSIPPDASKEHYLLARNLHWVKAEINKNPAGISKTIAVHTQAMSATFTNIKSETRQFSKPIVAESISKLVSGNGAIKSILQPYASFGGRPIEQESDFINRISERLRHKQRAKTVWDYERIVLEAFPFIYKVKSLNHSFGYTDMDPGHVTLIVIPDLLNKNAANPLQPKTSFVLRESIKDYVLQYMPLFVSLAVDNPKYEPIVVDIKVGLKPGFDGSFYGNLLNEQLKRFLSPWAFESGEDIIFGGRIYKSSILAFIEEQEYVDYVTDFRLFHLNKSPGIGEMCVGVDFEVAANTIGEEVLGFAEASTARSILVSANEHVIAVLQPGEFVCTGAEIPSGIGAMIVEYDFIVS